MSFLLNNTSQFDQIPPSTRIIREKDDLYFYVFHVLTPAYFVIAFTGHLLLIIGFIKRAKTDPAYGYQIILTIAKSVEILFFTIFVITFKWFSGIEATGRVWYQRSYILMWFSTHAAAPLANSFITTSLLLAVGMAADRLLALSKPFLYKTLTGNKHQIFAAVTSTLLGWLTSAFDWCRFDLKFNGDCYEGILDWDWMRSSVAKLLSNLRNSLRAMGLIALVLCNIGIVIAYRNNARIKQILNAGTIPSAAEERRIRQRKSAERILTVIVLVQSIVIGTSMSLFVVFYAIAYAWPEFSLSPYGIMFTCVMDAVLEIGDVVIFVIVVTIDKRIRNTIVTACGCMFKWNRIMETTDAPVSTVRRVSKCTNQDSDTTAVVHFPLK